METRVVVQGVTILEQGSFTYRSCKDSPTKKACDFSKDSICKCGTSESQAVRRYRVNASYTDENGLTKNIVIHGEPAQHLFNGLKETEFLALSPSERRKLFDMVKKRPVVLLIKDHKNVVTRVEPHYAK